jgi:hypothetical protein
MESPMQSIVRSLPTFVELRDHVRQTLCNHDRLDAQQAELREGKITRGDKTCGVFFQVRGPRLLRTYAIWAGEEHRVLFYESTGVRFAETKFTESPALETFV